MKAVDLTPRPQIDLNEWCPSEIIEERAKRMRKKIRRSRALTQAIHALRLLQVDIMRFTHKCTKKQAIRLCQDPNPYNNTYIFYCYKIESHASED